MKLNESKKDSEIKEKELKITEFTLRIKSKYLTTEINNKKSRLEIDNSKKNIDWCLDKLKNIELNEKTLSKIVYKSLIDLKCCFEIKISQKANDEDQCKTIKANVTENGITIEIIRERMIKLIKINPKIRELLSYQMQTKSMTQITHLLEKRIEFIGRENFIEKIKKKISEKSTRTVVLHSFGGMGKSSLANEYGHRIKDKDNGYIVRWILADKIDNFEIAIRQLARLFNVEKIEAIESLKILIDCLNAKIVDFNGNFIFILDNVDNYESIRSFMDGINNLPINKVKLLTLRKTQIISKNLEKYSN